MIEINNLHASLTDEDKPILKGLNLTIKPGEVHAIMGPNGSGKSTLANVLSGRDGYTVTDGSATFQGKDLFELEPEERAALGLFLAFQYPVEIPGVNNSYFLRTALNSQRKQQGLSDVDAIDFLTLVREKLAMVKMDEKFLEEIRRQERALNEPDESDAEDDQHAQPVAEPTVAPPSGQTTLFGGDA